jgi:large subunit ribosomal protein L23
MIVKPIITEQSLQEAQKGRFSFRVEKGDRKPAIKKAVEEAFGVTVVKVETAATPHKTYRVGRSRSERQSKRGKRAVVTLGKGQKIDLFEVGSDD